MFGLGAAELVILAFIGILFFVVPVVTVVIILLILSRRNRDNKPDAEP